MPLRCPNFCLYAAWKYSGVPRMHDYLDCTRFRNVYITATVMEVGDDVDNDIRPRPLPFVIHSACCEVVRVFGDLRLDPVTIE
jgi:hypothetical protein